MDIRSDIGKYCDPDNVTRIVIIGLNVIRMDNIHIIKQRTKSNFETSFE